MRNLGLPCLTFVLGSCVTGPSDGAPPGVSATVELAAKTVASSGDRLIQLWMKVYEGGRQLQEPTVTIIPGRQALIFCADERLPYMPMFRGGLGQPPPSHDPWTEIPAVGSVLRDGVYLRILADHHGPDRLSIEIDFARVTGGRAIRHGRAAADDFEEGSKRTIGFQ
ncbi:MAG TPA: hypothetical protein VI643_07625 [Planctomycetota bacterium]|nr:hypothetical protein [Planctomycetota bacterium]